VAFASSDSGVRRLYVELSRSWLYESGNFDGLSILEAKKARKMQGISSTFS
jgi:hypothetical protein